MLKIHFDFILCCRGMYGRDCTQHKDFSEAVYKKLKEKFGHVRLPLSWKRPQQPHNSNNMITFLGNGLKTPTSQQGSPMFSPNWGKQKLIKALTFQTTPKSNANNSPCNAMLSTQFNFSADRYCDSLKSNNKRPIPLFHSNDELPGSAESFDDRQSKRLLLTPDVNTDSLNDDSTAPSCSTINQSPIRPSSDMFSKALEDTVKRSQRRHSTPSPIHNIESSGNDFDHDHVGHYTKFNPANVLTSSMKMDDRNEYNVGSPFINFLLITEDEQDAVTELILHCAELSVSLVYSDSTTQIGVGVTTHSMKVTVTGYCLVIKEEDQNVGVFLPISTTGSNAESVINVLSRLFKSPSLKICFNAYQLYIVTSILIKSSTDGMAPKNLVDLKIASWLLTSDNVATSVQDLKQAFNVDTLSESGSFSSKLHTALTDLLDLKPVVYEALEREKLSSLYKFLECPLLGTICKMGQSGICIDQQKLNKLQALLTAKLHEVEKKASQIIGRSIQLTSHQQIRAVLYDELKLDQKISGKIDKTKEKREKSTSEPCLLQMIDVHPLPKLVLEHRHLFKIKSTYAEGLRKFMRFNKLYPSWDQTSASTGRLAAFNPNIQAFPKNTLESGGDKLSVRDIVIPSPGCSFVAVDFCSIELRILAHFAKDVELKTLFSQPGDVFRSLTGSWKNISPDDVTASDREKTKRVCYAIIYGVGINKLSQILEITSSEAKLLMASFLSSFPNIKRFTNAVLNRARSTKKLRTILNRLRHFPEINSAIFSLRTSIERQAINFVIQGSAADICKVSMLKLANALEAQTQINAKLLIQIHDELLYEVYDQNVEVFTSLIYQLLESPDFTNEIHLSVPLKVKVQAGKSWGLLEHIPNAV